MSRQTSRLPEAILRACGIDPNTVQSMTFTADAYSGSALLTITRYVHDAESGDVAYIQEQWSPA